MRAADSEYIAFACPTQLLLDIANTIDGVTSNPLEWYRRGYGACDHSGRKLWFGRKADIGGHVCGFQAIWIVGPFLRKIQRTIDERMTVARNVGSEDSDLAVRDLARRTSVLPRHSPCAPFQRLDARRPSVGGPLVNTEAYAGQPVLKKSWRLEGAP